MDQSRRIAVNAITILPQRLVQVIQSILDIVTAKLIARLLYFRKQLARRGAAGFLIAPGFQNVMNGVR